MASVTPTVSDLAVERAISKVAESFRFVLDITPVDVESQRSAFLDGKITDPDFTYREIEDAPDVLAASLKAIPLDDVEDAALRSLLAAKHDEVQLQIEMLRARCSRDFVRLSERLYGAIDSDLQRAADLILAEVRAPEGIANDYVQAEEFAELARLELAHYRSIEPDIGAHVEIRPDVAGVMASGNVLLISTATRIRTGRVHALLQHEVGTHLLTHVNGRFQPIGIMAAGLAGYEETQEGLAVLAEFLVDGLSPYRLRQLAARVLAVSRMLAGDTFAGVHEAIVSKGFSAHSAFTTTMRVFRSGGLTKDAIYLRGLLKVMEYARENQDLELLWMGKLSLDQLHIVEDLLARGMLNRPKLLPRCLDMPSSPARLQKAASLSGIAGLIGDTT